MKKQLTKNQQIIENDITNYKTNKLASNLALLGLVFNCLYFLFVYSQTTSGPSTQYTGGTLSGKSVYTIQMGVSVVLNLLILLSVFYASIGLKNYNKNMCYLVWVVAVIQIVRMFIYPIQVFNSTYGAFIPVSVFGGGTLFILILWLVLSAACLIGAGVSAFISTTKREAFLKKVAAGEVDLEAAYKDEDVPEVVADAQVDEVLKEEIKEENNEEAAEVSEDITGGKQDA